MFEPGGPTLRELLTQALSSTDRGYDLLAPKFDHTPFRTPDLFLDAAAPFLGPAERGLDLCSGTGAGVRVLRPACRDEVVAVDRSEGMLEQARAQPWNEGPGAAVRFVRGDALSLPIASERFDLVTCFGAFGHILEQDEDRFVGELHRVLKPGGRFVFFTSDAPPLWSPARWLAHGFNAAMRVRNALISPPFVMYYLTFLLPRARALLEAHGFSVRVEHPALPPRFRKLLLVTATRGAEISGAGSARR